MKRKKSNNSRGFQDVQALWESADDGEYPRGTLREGMGASSAYYIWDSIPENPLSEVSDARRMHRDAVWHHTHPAYAQSLLRLMRYVPRETPDTAREWYAPPLNPSECEYKRYTTDSKHIICELTHLPSGLVEVVRSTSAWRNIRKTAEFRLSEQLVASGKVCERARWLSQIEQKRRRSVFKVSGVIKRYAAIRTKVWQKRGSVAGQ